MSARGPELPTPINGVVTQVELANFLELRDSSRRYNEVRDSLAAKLMSGSVIEAGSLTARLSVTEQRRLSGPSLVPILGQDFVDELKSRVEPTAVRRIEVLQQ